MKATRKILISALFTVVSCTFAQAQYVPVFDRGVQQICLNAFPDYHIGQEYRSFDYYTQYAPAALMLSLKAGGYQSRSGWGRMLVSDAFSVAAMTSVTQGLKYSVRRMRPDGSNTKSFPSGHSATAFMTAAMLSREYGWRNPWWSIAGYSLATVTTVGRLAGNRHWMTDTFGGALIGVGSVELGYFLTDLIYKDRGLCDGYEHFDWEFCCREHVYYGVQYGYSRRFVVAASKTLKDDSVMPYGGANAHLTAEIPILPGSGVCVRGQAGSLMYRDGSSCNVYAGQAGLFWEREYSRNFSLQVQTLLGYARQNKGSGLDFSAAASINIIPRSNFKLKAIAEWETMSYATRREAEGKPFLNSILLGYSAGFYW